MMSFKSNPTPKATVANINLSLDVPKVRASILVLDGFIWLQKKNGGYNIKRLFENLTVVTGLEKRSGYILLRLCSLAQCLLTILTWPTARYLGKKLLRISKGSERK